MSSSPAVMYIVYTLWLKVCGHMTNTYVCISKPCVLTQHSFPLYCCYSLHCSEKGSTRFRSVGEGVGLFRVISAGYSGH